MKKSKKHQFSHPDPEKKAPVIATKGNSPEKTPQKDDSVPEFVYRDLKRTGAIITSFILMVVLLYSIQVKTSWFSPILKKFGL